jgi:NAD(P)-dependent dehydrogenase (short-subunit alcohol dehydrogenase family)
VSKELHGKNILVTGATEGIGKAAALEMARRGARLTIVGRNREKTARVLEAVRAAGAADADSILGDLSVLADIRAVARAYRERADRLDVLVNNAGAVFTSYATTPDGFERTFALNHLGYFLLTRELRPLLAASQGARVVSTSSLAHRMGRIELDEIARRERRKDAGFRPYGDSKLANILFTRELSRRLAPQGGVANCFHPGYVATGFALNNGDLLSKVQALVGPLVARTPEKGAETLVWLAASEAGGRASGEYFSDKKVSSTSKAARDDGLAAALWALSERLCGEA